jgi:ribosomal protein S8
MHRQVNVITGLFAYFMSHEGLAHTVVCCSKHSTRGACKTKFKLKNIPLNHNKPATRYRHKINKPNRVLYLTYSDTNQISNDIDLILLNR